MISRSQNNEKSSPPPRKQPLRGGGCQLILDLVGQIPLLLVKKNKTIGTDKKE